jgi:glycosyltransferase involved in cell wall biosynthesis
VETSCIRLAPACGKGRIFRHGESSGLGLDTRNVLSGSVFESIRWHVFILSRYRAPRNAERAQESDRVNRRPLRVLQIIYRADRAGAETWLVHLLRYIDPEDVAIDFVVHDERPGAYDREVKALGSRIFICDSHRNLWKQFWRLRGVLRRYGPYDAIHSHVDYFGGVIVLLARLLGIRTRIANCHRGAPEIAHGTLFHRRLYMSVMKLLVHWFATAGLATSGVAAVALFGPKWHVDSRWRVHRACVDLRSFTDLVNRQNVRAELSFPPNAVVFGHVGRFVAEKNHGFLVRVAERLVQRNDRVRFMFVGEGPRKQQIEDMIRERGLQDRVVVLPPRNDIPRLMLGALDFFLFPSWREGLGLALIEAQAAGLRCFASTAVPPDAIVMPSLVRQLPLSAGPGVWAEAILKELDASNPVSQPEALRNVEEMFDIRRNAEQLVEFYREVTA